MYELYRLIDGKWYLYGMYNTPTSLARACFELGKMGVTQIEIKENSDG